MSFMDELNEVIEESNKNNKVTLIEKIYGIKGAFNRAKKQSSLDGVKSIFASEKEVIERQVCCSLCNKGRKRLTCPFCGCNIKKTWFMPLGKSELTTEGCPNSESYPHLNRFPPKNYWKVCHEKSSIIFFYKNDDFFELSDILDKLRKNATGEIEIIVGINDDTCISLSKEMDNIVFIKGAEDIGELRGKSQGDYIFLLDECDYDYLGYDTKLKYKYE